MSPQTMPPPSSSPTGSVIRSTTLPAETASVPAGRRFVRSVVEPHVRDAPVIADLELMASELVTNAVEHGADHPIQMTVSAAQDQVVLSVTSHGNATEVGPGSAWSVADVTSITGRGLGIVRALADTVDVGWHDDAVTITVERKL